MSKKDGAVFSKSLFGYKKRDVNEYIRLADENNSARIKESEEKIKELEAALATEKSSSISELTKLTEEKQAISAEAEKSKNNYEAMLSESEARAKSYLKLAESATQRAEAAEARIAELSSMLEDKDSEVTVLKEKLEASEKQIVELTSSVARYALREETEKKEQAKYIKFRRPAFFRLIKR